MLQLRRLTKHFDGIVAVSDLNLEVKTGRITALIGPNGAGKTTLFNLIMGIVIPTGGEVIFKGQNLLRHPPHTIARLGITRTFQEGKLFRKMTVMDNLLIARRKGKYEDLWSALARRPFWKESSEELRGDLVRKLATLDLAEKMDDAATDLSYGQSKLLEILRAAAAEPDLLLLDEPVAGVHPVMVEKIKRYLIGLVKEEGKTVFLIEHNIPFVFEIADWVVVMDHGLKIAEGAPEDIRGNLNVIEAYLGAN